MIFAENIENTFSQDDLMLILSWAGNAEVLSAMLSAAKKDYVTKRHNYTISQIAKGTKAGKWKTYVGKPRKEVVRNTEEELLEALYQYYKKQEEKPKTFREVTEAWFDYKVNNQNRSVNSINAYRDRLKNFLPESFWERKVQDVSEEEIEQLFVKQTRELHPRPDALRKSLQYVRAVFKFAVKKKWCLSNPTLTVELADLYAFCNLAKKSNEEKEFSEREIQLLRDDALRNKSNPRALMTLLAAETGMRCAELSALRWEDISDDFIHIHRQQVIEHNGKGNRKVYEVQYTKDERQHPHDGRWFPITDEIAEVLELAKALDGNSIYVFHSNNQWVNKDGYAQYLKKHCRRLGISTTNNHAFRMSLNNRLMDEGYEPSQRALLLGHSIETNERHYSFSDKRTLSTIRERMVNKKESPTA